MPNFKRNEIVVIKKFYTDPEMYYYTSGTLNGLHGTIGTENGTQNGLHGTIRTENGWNALVAI
jgi:hypothetical protein